MRTLRTRRTLRALAAALAITAMLASPAFASGATFKRSIENLAMFPFDIVMSPVVAIKSVVVNLQEIDDSLAVRIFYPIPGVCWNTMVQLGASALRGVTGAIELIPGIFLLFTHGEMDPLFDPADENEALVDWDELEFFHVKFGIDYTTAGY